VGIIQSSRDIVMSLAFGNRTQAAHENAVFGDLGLARAFENPKDRCASWIPRTQEHVFLSDGNGRDIKTRDGLTPHDFLVELMDASREDLPSHE
jgi:hypothetical protein